MNEDRALLKKLAAEHYDGLAATGGSFLLADVEATLRRDGMLANLGDALVAEAVHRVVQSIDADRRRSEQASMFGDGDQVLALASTERRRRGSCRRKELVQHLTHVQANASKVAAAAAREQEEFELLDPYLLRGLTHAEAVAAYAADHPEDRP